MNVIVFSGWKESGKDMCADYLVENYGYKRLAFADPLKVMVAEQYNIPLEHMYNRDFKEKAILHMPVSPRDGFSRQIANMLSKEFCDKEGCHYDYCGLSGDSYCGYEDPSDENSTGKQLYWTPRALCILEGSVKRSANPGYWIDQAVDNANPDQNYVISDLRYCNEANQLIALQEAGKIDKLILIRINRWGWSPSEDPSERDLDDYEFDCYINNSDKEGVTKQQVYDQLMEIIRQDY